MSSTSAATALELHNQKVVSDGRKQFCAATSEHLLDYKHNNPHHIVNASTMLIKIFSNVVENPSEEKFRKARREGQHCACTGGGAGRRDVHDRL